MLQVRNETPFSPGMFLFPDAQGVDTMYVVLKATFSLKAGRLHVAETQVPVLVADKYRGEPGQSSLKAASEAHLLKPGTDVLVEGEAHSPKGRAVESCLVQMQVGPVRQVLQVFGDRKWKGGLMSPSPSAPAPFVTMPLVWERAFGGMHQMEKERPLGAARNPVGQGFRGKRSGSEMAGRALPNLENPRQLIRSISDVPTPVGVGPVAPAWEPRKSYAGTYDEAWQTRRAPYLPRDFKAEFFHVAPPELCASEGLKGGEPVELLSLSPGGALRFTLPRCEVQATVRIAGRPERPLLRLETVHLTPAEGQVCMTWRGAVPCDKRSLQVEQVRFQLLSMDVVAA
ncbi:DUF2169 domain-containing protein [Myxococcus sp. SDU36]|uniref:DUF2169 family type VI secretion system accessory protein n=1 Tax=Myxococcus sp. SDU36 TaxID=2831967 RepID=UPI002543BAF8|nr:DUF2169 domain-containing protein [Myxococcus sp. SDU36]WIG94791.1 DUF2169 domain-containing protein [Myxococcus sp. SDU36]